MAEQASRQSNLSSRDAASSVSSVYGHDRETRPGEVTDAVMFAMAAGLSVDAAAVDHRRSHVRKTSVADDAELSGVSVVSRDPEPPIRLTLHAEEAQPTARRLLDLSLMKLGADGTRMVRVEAEAGLAATLWRDASWLEKLPDLTEATKARRWDDALMDCTCDAIEAVQRALTKAQDALHALNRDAGSASGKSSDAMVD